MKGIVSGIADHHCLKSVDAMVVGIELNLRGFLSPVPMRLCGRRVCRMGMCLCCVVDKLQYTTSACLIYLEDGLRAISISTASQARTPHRYHYYYEKQRREIYANSPRFKAESWVTGVSVRCRVNTQSLRWLASSTSQINNFLSLHCSSPKNYLDHLQPCLSSSCRLGRTALRSAVSASSSGRVLLHTG